MTTKCTNILDEKHHPPGAGIPDNDYTPDFDIISWNVSKIENIWDESKALGKGEYFTKETIGIIGARFDDIIPTGDDGEIITVLTGSLVVNDAILKVGQSIRIEPQSEFCVRTPDEELVNYDCKFFKTKD